MIGGVTRNATEFEKKFRRICDDYLRVYGPEITAWLNPPSAGPNDTDAQVQLQLKAARETSLKRDVLEYQIRVWKVDGFLHSLNWIQNSSWRSQPTPVNMLPEATVVSVDGEKRRMDYFGYERTTQRPLLIVETKRPSDELPVPPGGLRNDSISTFLIKALRNKEKLPKKWKEWLDSLKDYVQSVHAERGAYPLRVVLTNGEWCLIFMNPKATFEESDHGKPEDILVFESTSDILDRAGEIVAALEYSRVLGRATDLESGELRFTIDVDHIDRLSFGVRLAYEKTPTADESLAPIITVVPLILARSTTSGWIRIKGGSPSRQIPPEADHLPSHLQQVHDDAQSLMSSVRTQLNAIPQMCSVSEHYASPESFSGQPGVLKVGDRWIVFTGTETHYFREQPTVLACPYHDWLRCSQEGVQQGAIGIFGKTVESPRTFFESGTEHHCAHRVVFTAKQSPITEANRDRCGARSGQDEYAFCEIAPFEDHLCCRTCVFEDVCTKADVFRLPCTLADPNAIRTSNEFVQLH